MAPEERSPGNDPLAMAMELAAGLKSSGDQPPTAEAGPDLGKLLEALMAQKSAEQAPTEAPMPVEEPDLRLAALSAALPQIMQAMSGNGDLVEAQKLDLVKAVKPYLPAGQSGSVDRAIRIANVTKAAKNALRMLGR